MHLEVGPTHRERQSAAAPAPDGLDQGRGARVVTYESGLRKLRSQSAELLALATWLDLNSGNCLVLNSQDYLYDNNITSFGSTYLGIATENDDEGNTTATGRNFFAMFPAQTLQYGGLYTNFNDVVTTTAGTLSAFHATGGTSSGAGAIYRDNATWKTALFTVALEAFPAASRQAIFDRTMEYCDAIFQDGFDTNSLTRWSSSTP